MHTASGPGPHRVGKMTFGYLVHLFIYLDKEKTDLMVTLENPSLKKRAGKCQIVWFGLVSFSMEMGSHWLFEG